MNKTMPVVPGINLSRALGDQPLTVEWVREAMRDHVEWDWRNVGPDRGTYVNGEDCIRFGLTLDVKVNNNGFTEHLCFVDFQATPEAGPSGYPYQAVVR